MGSGLFQGITIDMSLSSTASGEAAGERTQLSSLVSAGVILAVVVFLAPLLHNLPTAVLGAIVLASILGLFNFAEFRRYYRQRKTDFVLALTALMGVLTTSVMVGLAIAALLSVIMLLYRASRPYIAILGRRANGEFGDTGRHADAQAIPGLVILRLDAPLYFFNANVARTQILEQTSKEPRPRAILLDIGASADLDIGTSDMLRDLIDGAASGPCRRCSWPRYAARCDSGCKRPGCSTISAKAACFRRSRAAVSAYEASAYEAGAYEAGASRRLQPNRPRRNRTTSKRTLSSKMLVNVTGDDVAADETAADEVSPTG